MATDPITIRQAVPGDAAALAELSGRTFRATYRGSMPDDVLDAHTSAEFGPAQQAAELADPACRVVVAERGSTMVGHALVRAGVAPVRATDDATVQLVRLYVEEQVQARGVGRGLLDSVREAAARDGHRRLWLTVWEHNTRARAIYRRWGFVDVGDVPFDVEGEVQRDRVLVLDLA